MFIFYTGLSHMIFMLITRKNVDTLLQIIAVGIDVNMMIIIL